MNALTPAAAQSVWDVQSYSCSHDAKRTDYFARHITAVAHVMRQGVIVYQRFIQCQKIVRYDEHSTPIELANKHTASVGTQA
jgi:hypothetical protein